MYAFDGENITQIFICCQLFVFKVVDFCGHQWTSVDKMDLTIVHFSPPMSIDVHKSPQLEA